MAKKMNIQGTVQYLEISTGFWGIIDSEGRKWRPVDDLPKELQEKGKKVSMTIRPLQVEMSIFMWGEPMEILDYQLS